jgi:hypothetical protein
MSPIRVVYSGLAFAVVAGVLWLPFTYLLGTSPTWWLVVVGVIAVGFIAIWYWYEWWGEERALRQKIHNREKWEHPDPMNEMVLDSLRKQLAQKQARRGSGPTQFLAKAGSSDELADAGLRDQHAVLDEDSAPQ